MRYLPLTEADRRDMLAAIGVASVDSLFKDVPAAAMPKQPFDLPGHQGEIEVERAIAAMAAKNVAAGSVPFFLGAGAYRHHVPATVDYMVQRGEFLTSYTPYQPEISQGTLQYLFEFQTQVALLTGMDVANASMYDGASATAEAALMACRITKRSTVLLSGGLHGHYADVTETAFSFVPSGVVTMPPDPEGSEDLAGKIDRNTACVVVQYPDAFGRLRDWSALAETCHDAGALFVVVVTEPVALGLVEPPGAMGADIVTGEGKSLGNALNFGGPYLGLFACRDKFLRQMPGRIAGETSDVDGRRGWVLTLSAREQHIRREKATSNICTNSGLCALAFTVHLALLGEEGLRRLAGINHANAVALAGKLGAVKGVEILTDAFFNEFTIRLPRDAGSVVDALAVRNVLGGVPASRLYPDADGVSDLLIVCATETSSAGDMDAFARALREVLA